MRAAAHLAFGASAGAPALVLVELLDRLRLATATADSLPVRQIDRLPHGRPRATTQGVAVVLPSLVVPTAVTAREDLARAAAD